MSITECLVQSQGAIVEYEATVTKVAKEVEDKRLTPKEARHELSEALAKVKARSADVLKHMEAMREDLARRCHDVGKKAQQQTANCAVLMEELEQLRKCFRLPGVISDEELIAKHPELASLPARKRLLQRIRYELEARHALHELLVAKREARGDGDATQALSGDARSKLREVNAAAAVLMSLPGVSYKPMSRKEDDDQLMMKTDLSLPLKVLYHNIVTYRMTVTSTNDHSNVRSIAAEVVPTRKRDATGKATGSEVKVTLTAVLDSVAGREAEVTLLFRNDEAGVLVHAACTSLCHLTTSHFEQLLPETVAAEPSPSTGGWQALRWVELLAGQGTWPQIPVDHPTLPSLLSTGKDLPATPVTPMLPFPIRSLGAFRPSGGADEIFRCLVQRIRAVDHITRLVNQWKEGGGVLTDAGTVQPREVREVTPTLGPRQLRAVVLAMPEGIDLYITVPIEYPRRPSHVLCVPQGTPATLKGSDADRRCLVWVASDVPSRFANASLVANRDIPKQRAIHRDFSPNLLSQQVSCIWKMLTTKHDIEVVPEGPRPSTIPQPHRSSSFFRHCSLWCRELECWVETVQYDQSSMSSTSSSPPPAPSRSPAPM